MEHFTPFMMQKPICGLGSYFKKYNYRISQGCRSHWGQSRLSFSRFSDNFLANHRRRSRSTAGLVFLDHILFKVEAKFYFCKKQVINSSASMIIRFVNPTMLCYSRLEKYKRVQNYQPTKHWWQLIHANTRSIGSSLWLVRPNLTNDCLIKYVGG